MRTCRVRSQARKSDEIGGSTYHFRLWRGHPFESEVVGELARFRERMSALRNKLDDYNKSQPGAPATLRVVAYYGQSTVEEEVEHEDATNRTTD